MLDNIGNAITRLKMDRFGRNLGGCIPSCPRHVRHDAVAMVMAVTYSSYWRLEAECMNHCSCFMSYGVLQKMKSGRKNHKY